MADAITFGDGIEMFGPAAFIRTIFSRIRVYANDDVALMEIVAKEEVFDAQGWWVFDSLPLPSLERLQNVVNRIKVDVPNAIANWNEQYRPRFYVVFDEFEQKLANRVDQLKQSRQGPNHGGPATATT